MNHLNTTNGRIMLLVTYFTIMLLTTAYFYYKTIDSELFSFYFNNTAFKINLINFFLYTQKEKCFSIYIRRLHKYNLLFYRHCTNLNIIIILIILISNVYFQLCLQSIINSYLDTQILTQEDWNIVLFNGMEKTSHWAALYFVTLMTFGNYVLFNLLVAILVEGFSSEVMATADGIISNAICITNLKSLMHDITFIFFKNHFIMLFYVFACR